MASPLERYVAGRERILGGVWVHRDPKIAVEMLSRDLGGDDRVAEWLLAALEWLEVTVCP